MLRNVWLAFFFWFWLLLMVFILEFRIFLQLPAKKGATQSDGICSCNTDTKIVISRSILSHFPSQLIPAYEVIRKQFKSLSWDLLALLSW